MMSRLRTSPSRASMWMSSTPITWREVTPPAHADHQFNHVTSGKGIMVIEGDEREISQGDLVHIPPDAVHSLRPVSDNASIHCFCFAVGVKDAEPVDYTTN